MILEKSWHASMRQVTFKNQITSEQKGKKQPYTRTGERHQCFIYPCKEHPLCQRKLIGTDQYKFTSREGS